MENVAYIYFRLYVKYSLTNRRVWMIVYKGTLSDSMVMADLAARDIQVNTKMKMLKKPL